MRLLNRYWGLMAGVLLLAACSGESPAEPEKKTFLPYPIHTDTLENRLQVVTVPYESPGLASFYIIVRVGSRHEVEEGKTGFAHFFEHMMFRGTDKYPSDEYSNVLKSMGAGANANTWLDRTVYHMTGNANHLDRMFEVEADRFRKLNYSESDFKVEAGAVKGEYTKNFASQYRQLDEAIKDTAFEAHTYKHTTMGFFEDIVDMPNQYEYSLEFYDRFYSPEYTTILVVGDATHDQVVKLSKEYFGDWEQRNYIPEIPVEPVQTRTKYVHIENGNFVPTLSLNYKTPAFDATSKEVAALDLISSIGFSERSDLYKKLVVDDQTALSLNASYFFTTDPYLFSIMALTRDESNLQPIKDEIDGAIEQLRTELVDSTLLADTKSNSKYSMLMSMDDPSSIAETMSYFIWVSGKPNDVNTYMETLMSVTPEDIRQTAQKYFVDTGLTVGTISSKPEGGIQ